MVKITAQIDGMMCDMCEAHVNEAVRRAFPVKKVTSSHKKGQTIILTEQDIPDDALRQAIAPAGYVLVSAAHGTVQRKGWFRS